MNEDDVDGKNENVNYDDEMMLTGRNKIKRVGGGYERNRQRKETNK